MPKKKWLPLIPLLIVALIVVAVAVGIGVNHKQETKKLAEQLETVTGPETKTETTTETATQPVQTTPAAPRTVIDITGNADKISTPFSLGSGSKTLRYNVTNVNIAPLLMIYLVPEGSPESEYYMHSVTSTSSAGPGETQLVNEPGTYYLKVSSANCDWQVKITEQ